jgi:hypothetical protein
MSALAPAPRLAAAVAAALLAACAGARARTDAAPPERRVFQVAGGGAVAVEVPAGWTASEVAGDPGAPVTVRLERPGAGFVALLTPFRNPGEPEDAAARGDAARLLADLARKSALRTSAERDLPLEELSGDGVRGFWFLATDRELVGKEPGPEEWPYLLQGVAAVGRLFVAFTLLDHGPGAQRQELLALVRGARDAGAGPDEAAPHAGMELDPGARTLPLRVALAGRAWAVLVDLPGFAMFRPRASGDGTGLIVLGQSPDAGIVASVILRAAGGAGDAAACRAADLQRIRAGAPGVGEVRLAEAGEAARAAYLVAGESAPQAHAHAWLFRDGTCANVHVSRIGPGAEDAARLEAILGSVRFGEDL